MKKNIIIGVFATLFCVGTTALLFYFVARPLLAAGGDLGFNYPTFLPLGYFFALPGMIGGMIGGGIAEFALDEFTHRAHSKKGVSAFFFIRHGISLFTRIRYKK